MRKLRRENLEHILEGALLLGSGGGGPRAAGLKMIGKILEYSGDEGIDLATFNEDINPTDSLGLVAADVGGADVYVENQDLASWYAFQTLEKLQIAETGEHFSWVAPIETGGENTMVPMIIAARKKVPVIDGDGAGRAVPQIELTGYGDRGISPSPAVISNTVNQSITISNIPSAVDFDAAIRPVVSSGIFSDSAGMVLYRMTGKQMAEAIIPGTISLAEKIGEALISAGKNKKNPVSALRSLSVIRIFELFEGNLVSFNDSVSLGFDINTAVIRNSNNEECTILGKNENLIAWRSGLDHPAAMAPDSICVLTSSGIPLSNAEMNDHIGESIYVLGIQANEKIRSTSLIEGFLKNLKDLGYHGPYVPVESINRS